LALLPARARSVGPSAGLLEGPDGGVVFVFGLATFNYANADQAARRLAAVQLVTTKIASVAEVASAFGVNEATLWRWKRAFGTGGVLGLVAERPGTRRPSKLTKCLAARIVKLDATCLTLEQIAAAAGVSTATVRVALGRITPRDQTPVEPDVDVDEPKDCDDAAVA
jgi:transposase-like protein